MIVGVEKVIFQFGWGEVGVWGDILIWILQKANSKMGLIIHGFY